jgi:predicted PurR-regulated permease PerM
MPLDLARLILAIIAILGLMLASLWIVSPFFTAIIWATMIVVSCWPLMLRLQAVLNGRRALAVTVMTLLMLAVFIVPVLLAVNTIVDNVDTLLRWAKMASSFELPPSPAWVAQIPLVGTRLSELWSGLHEAGLSSLVQRAAPYAGKGAQLVAGQAGNLGLLIIHFLLTVLIAAVMFAQGEEGARRVLALADRVGGERGEAAVRLAAAAIRGVAISVVGTALIQTLLASVGLAVAGVPFVGLLTAATLILCIAQVGPGPVLIPAIIWMYWTGETGWGTFLLVWSVIAMTVDNFVRPVLVRFGADLPLLLIFAGVIGGMLTMGLVGLFVGPVVLAVTWRLFEAWAGLYVPSTAAAAVSAPVVVEGAVGESTAATSAAGSPAAQVAIAANNEPAPVAPVAPHGTPTA